MSPRFFFHQLTDTTASVGATSVISHTSKKMTVEASFMHVTTLDSDNPIINAYYWCGRDLAENQELFVPHHPSRRQLREAVGERCRAVKDGTGD
jgi:hypothetical protein